MSDFVACPGCQKRYPIRAELAGKRIKCRSCGSAIAIPTAVAPIPFAPEAEAVRAAPTPAPLTPAPAQPPAAKVVSVRRAPQGGKTRSQPVGNPYRVPLLLLKGGYFPFLGLLCLVAGGGGLLLIVSGMRGFHLDREALHVISAPSMILGVLGVGTALHLIWGLRVLLRKVNEKDVLEFELPQQWQEGLIGLVEQVVEELDLPAPDVIRLHAADVAHIYQDKKGRSVLAIGGLAVAAYSQRALSGIIAHELGHLAAGDTAMSRSALRGHRVMAQLEQQLAGKPEFQFNLLVWLVRAYHLLYAVLWFANMRRQEYAADRHQVDLVGKEQAAATLMLFTLLDHLPGVGLADLAESCVETNEQVGQIFAEQVRRVKVARPSEWEDALRRALRRPSHWDDTHPILQDRLKAIGVAPKKALGLVLDLLDPAEPPASALFANWPLVERFLTDRILDIVREHYLARKEYQAIVRAVFRQARE